MTIIRTSISAFVVLAALLAASLSAHARGLTYGLQADEIADGVYVFWGLQENWNVQNGGNIVNTGFIVGDKEVLAIDTGPTKFYADEMIRVIRSITDKPIRNTVVTHHHPDHSFGLQRFKKINSRVMMHPEARAGLLRDGAALIGFMEIAMGQGWMAGTEIDKPNKSIRQSMKLDLGGRTALIMPLDGGHTPGDVIVMDQKTGTLFAGDLIFHQRAPTVPHADIPTWLDHLNTMSAMDWQRIVPGHGPLVTDRSVFNMMADYLEYLQQFAEDSVARGDTLADAMTSDVPERFHGLSTLQIEYRRSMLSLFRKIETQDFDAAAAVN